MRQSWPSASGETIPRLFKELHVLLEALFSHSGDLQDAGVISLRKPSLTKLSLSVYVFIIALYLLVCCILN